ncbi:hypothetical protein ABI59_11090 [Acidobacteria bacterium Mor1]|nr:hypothetical protein ABI59_11090 [Acidobacteria bacterium Mor1]
MLNLDLRDLELVREVAATGSLTAAAGRLNVTQSALSHRLQELEGRLGAPLFERQSRRMVLTRAGERLARTASRALGEIQVAWDETRALAGSGVGTLRLSTACYTGYAWLADVLEGFRGAHPGIEVVVDADATHGAVDAVRGGTLDLALAPGPTEDERLLAEPLFEDELVVLLPPDHPLAAEPYITPAHFAELHLIGYSADPKQSFFLGGVLGPAGVTPQRVTGVPLTEAIIELVKAGQGVAALARWAVAPHLENGALIARPFGSQGLRRCWHAVTLRRDPAPAHLATFVELLRERLPAMLSRGGAAAVSEG